MVVNSENDGHCFKILSLSYSHLPIHLKPCFLYLGVFPEDQEIIVSRLTKSWIAEGFIKPTGSGETMEKIAEECLNELIDRNLVLVHKRDFGENIKSCKIHDLLRDISVKESLKSKFRCEESTRKLQSAVADANNADVSCTKFLRKEPNLIIGVDQYEVDEYCQRLLLELVNFRFIDFTPNNKPTHFSSIAHMFWNLQTIVIKNSEEIAAPSSFWDMPQLRHIKIKVLTLSDPPTGHLHKRNGCILKNLQTFMNIKNFKCSEAFLQKIPSIKKLKIAYDDFSRDNENGNGFHLKNLRLMSELEALSCSFGFRNRPKREDLLRDLVFPSSLKRLSLSDSNLFWEDMSTMIGSLPKLEVLKLHEGSFRGTEWNLNDERESSSFLGLKFLMIERCNDLKHWRADEANFPSLVSVVLRFMNNLEEIPSGFGDIATLRFIKLENCSDSAIVSAKNIVEYQQSFGIEDLQVEVRPHYASNLEISTSKNFIVRR